MKKTDKIKRGSSSDKSDLHPRNKHRFRYDFDSLSKACPELLHFIFVNDYGNKSIDFSNPDAVIALNKALLRHFYNISDWDIPANYLCPPIPGRADYIHYMADLLASVNANVIPLGTSLRGLDIGVGANCIYPIIGSREYGWSFVGSDVNPKAIRVAENTVAANQNLDIECRVQHSSADIFSGIIKPGEIFDFTICNPPFHSTAEEGMKGTNRKLKNLGLKQDLGLNFGGQSSELWYPGGEIAFVRKMIEQSKLFSKNCFWFSSLISKKENLHKIYSLLNYQKAADVRTIPMAQGQKISRVVAWTFLTPGQQEDWKLERWSI